SASQPVFPALYCRHCGRSGWGVTLSPADTAELSTADDSIRRDHAQGSGRFRPLIHATREQDLSPTRDTDDGPRGAGLRWFHVGERRLLVERSEDEHDRTAVLPVLTHTGAEAGDASRNDDCPACGQRDGIRFLGSAVATQLSVSLSTLFGSTNVSPNEKKTLVFTDSVQDAAHRAGFVQARSHSLTVRSMLRDAVGDQPCTLEELADRVLRDVGDDRAARYRILPPDLADRDEFRPFWQAKTLRAVPEGARNRVRLRIKFDAALEFGLQSRIGRTLELTSTVAAQVRAPASTMAVAARQALEDAEIQLSIDGPLDDARLTAWVRGVLEHLRVRGGIEHKWLKAYIKHDGARYRIWGGRPRREGMPAFPVGRSAPAFARSGPEPKPVKGKKPPERLLDQVTGHLGWYAQWASRVLQVPARDGAVLSRLLFAQLEKLDLVEATHNDVSADVFGLAPGNVVIEPVATDAWKGGRRH
ncbi:MAG: hypothetical protein Q7T55_11625, partial [Solirubrobacteraceae bacterium]|nr:hypothetical protein [Solirubrobacteraceae bacterium]